jgi:hypothetical protein
LAIGRPKSCMCSQKCSASFDPGPGNNSRCCGEPSNGPPQRLPGLPYFAPQCSSQTEVINLPVEFEETSASPPASRLCGLLEAVQHRRLYALAPIFGNTSCRCCVIGVPHKNCGDLNIAPLSISAKTQAALCLVLANHPIDRFLRGGLCRSGRVRSRYASADSPSNLGSGGTLGTEIERIKPGHRSRTAATKAARQDCEFGVERFSVLPVPFVLGLFLPCGVTATGTDRHQI